jgi:hypothetical protein
MLNEKERRRTHLIPNTTLLHPFSNPGLRLFKLVVAGSVNKVASLVKEKVEDLVDSFLVAGTHVLLPGVTKVHGTKA